MKSIIQKYLNGESSDQEQEKLLNWLRQHENLTEFQEIKNNWKNEIRNEDIPSSFIPDWNNIQNRLFGQLHSEINRTRRLLTYFRYAAIFLILITVPALIYFLTQFYHRSQLNYTTVAADYGQISKVVLPDSTVIWINSGSAVTYDNQFGKTDRNVQLIGEAFFKVRRNKDLPMVVSSSELRVKVLGTEFCVTAYPEEKTIQVVLEKGSIELSTPKKASFAERMIPGELANFDRQNLEASISHVNTGLFTSWKDGIINIYNLPLSEVVLKLEKRYNQQFVVDKAIQNLPYTYTIKNEKLNDILSLMEKITPIDAIQHGNVIELKYNKKKQKE